MEKISSEFNKALACLNRAVKSTREKYNAIIKDYESAEKEWIACPKNPLPGDPLASRAATARARWEEARGGLQGKVTDIFNVYDRNVRQIRAELARALAEADTLTAAEVDPAAIALLNSGAMTSRDYAKMAEQYQENATILKLLREGANKYADSLPFEPTEDPAGFQERMAMREIIERAKTGSEQALEGFDGWVSAANSLTGRDSYGNFRTVDEMRDCTLDAWEQLCGEMGVSFDDAEV